MRPNAVEQRQRGRTFQGERQVPEVARQRHLEQPGPLEVRDGVDPSARATPVQPFPEQPQWQADSHDPQGNAHSRERFRQRPEEDPGERERVPGKGERGEQHRNGCRNPPHPAGAQRNRPALGNVHEAEPYRGQDGGEADRRKRVPRPRIR